MSGVLGVLLGDNASAGGGSTVALDAVQAIRQINSGSSDSATFTPTGTPTGILVALFSFTGGAGAGASGITYGGQAMTRIVTIDSSAPGTIEIWGKAGPLSGAQTIAITMNGGGNFAQWGAMSVTGSDTGTFSTASSSATNTGTSVSTTCNSQVGDMVVDFGGAFSSADFSSHGGSQTTVWANDAFGGDRAAGSRASGASPNVAMTWTLGASAIWCQVAVSIKHA